MFAAGGYEATSLRQIASAAEIDIATLKYHFGDKPALFTEVYRIGHEGLLHYLNPCLEQLNGAFTRDALLVAIEDLVFSLHDFIEEHFAFVRLVLYRMLEGKEETITVEEELQGLAIEKFDDAFRKLHQRKLIRSIDQRALISLLVSAFTTWFLIAEVKPTWMDEPNPLTPAGRKRSEAFFTDLLERLLVDDLLQ